MKKEYISPEIVMIPFKEKSDTEKEEGEKP